ncbi:MAG: hypothetical protein M1832_001700 [Thelocarpon impressellum]|nr:MAG: hypothetical protein M1832_001700 [Thelocarpon impressellum]
MYLIAIWSVVALTPLVAIAAYVPGKAFDRFITIWLENMDFSDVEKNPDMKFLAELGVLLTNFYGLTHPSQPNYIASVGGDYFGMGDDGFVTIPANISTVVDLFDTKGIDWREYMEDTPGPGYMGPSSSNSDGKLAYVRKHNPLISYDSIARNGSRLLNVVSFADFDIDLKRKELPQYAHMSPNMLNDGHDTSLEFATKWTRDFLTPLLKDPYFMEKTLVLLTYDESETYSKPNKIASLLLGGAVPDELKGKQDDTFYTHYSILSTLENNWDLPNLGRYDVGANVFDLVAKKTGYKNRRVDVSTVDLSVSYPGALNKQNTTQYPAPNPFLTGAGGQGVLKSVAQKWFVQAGSSVNTPYDGSGDVFDGAKSLPVYKQQSASSADPGSLPTATASTTPTFGAAGSQVYVTDSISLFLMALGATFVTCVWR